MQAIRDFISIESHDVDADLLVLATTRPQGYSDEFDPSLYRHVTLAPLNASEALAYGSLLADARHPGQRTRIEELTTSLTRATKNEATVRLMQSPLQVTIMLALIEGGGEPPEQRWKLFHDYYNVIYRREKERGTAYSTILGRYEPDIHWIHKRVGWVLQQRNAEPGRTGDRLSHAEFEAIADQRLTDVGHTDMSERHGLVVKIRLAATDRLVLLVGNTENEIGFEIRSLQEFMAAEHCFDGGESCVQKTLHAIAPYSYWRNVFMFIAGRVFFERQELIDTLHGVLWQMNEEGDVTFRATLAGSRLALGLLKDGAARNQPGATRVIARCAARALDLRDDELTRSFPEVFASHAEEVMRTELVRRLNESSDLFPEHSWLICFWLHEMGKPWAQEAVTDFPFSHEGARRLISRFSEWLPISFWRAFAPHVFSHPLSTFIRILRRHPEDRPWRTVIPKALVQFAGLIYHGNMRDQVSLLCGDQQIKIELLSPGQHTLESWSRLDYRKIDLSNAHPCWRVYHAVSEFARNPSLSNLQSQLLLIGEADPSGNDHLLTRSMPWQVAASIAARRSGVTWPEVIRQVSAGFLGAEADWQRWETQLKGGMRFQDLRVADKLTVSDNHKGLMLGDSPWIYPQPANPTKFIQQVIKGIREWPDFGPKESLIDLCCFMLQDLSQRQLRSWPRPQPLRQDTSTAVRGLIELCRDLDVSLPSSILLPIILGEWELNEKRDLLIHVGRQRIQQGYVHPASWAEIDERLSSELPGLLASDNQAYVLRALSFLPPLDAIRQLKGLPLERLSAADGELSDAAYVLKSSTLDWTVQEVSQIVKRVLSLRESYPQHIDQMISFIEQDARTSPQLEEFFLELITQTTATRDINLLETATSILAKLVDRRSPLSSLPETARNLHSRSKSIGSR